MQYLLLRGGYFSENKLYKKGDVVKSNTNLLEKFPGKFSIVEEQTQSEDTSSTTTVPEDIGELVNDRFDFSPKETGLCVYLREKRYYVYETSDLSVSLNEKGLKRSEVSSFISSQCEG